MSTSSQTVLLNMAGVMEGVLSHFRNGSAVEYEPLEVVAATMQALLQMLAGGTPSNIELPQYAPAGLTDAVIARFSKYVIPGAPYAIGGANLTTKTGVLADGSTTAVTFPTAFQTSCTQILGGFTRDYNGTDNATLIPRIVTGSITKTGFSIIVSGGQTGSTCSVDYLPFGV